MGKITLLEILESLPEQYQEIVWATAGPFWDKLHNAIKQTVALFMADDPDGYAAWVATVNPDAWRERES